MAKSSDWLPSSREGRLRMGKDWVVQINERKSVYDIPPEHFNVLEEKVRCLGEHMSVPKTMRTMTKNNEIQYADDELTKIMRDIKRRYFFVPPLTTADLMLLGIKPRDTIPTNVNAPRVQMTGQLSCPGKGLVDLKNIHSVGMYADNRSDYGVRIYYGILGSPDDNDKFPLKQEPRVGSDLPHSVFTKHKKYRFDFTGSSGKHAFFCLQCENSKGQPGPWGEIIETYIA